MSENKTLQEFAKRHWIRKLPKTKPLDQKAKEEARLYREGGFTSISNILQRENLDIINKNKETETLNQFKDYIILKKPIFKRVEIDVHEVRNIIGFSIVGIVWCFILLSLPPLVMSIIPLILIASMLLGAMGILRLTGVTGETASKEIISFDGKRLFGLTYLASIPREKYTGHVPLDVVRIAKEKEAEGFQLSIWTVAKRYDLAGLIKSEKVIVHDPLLVGRKRMMGQHVLLFAIWGNDIQDLDTYLSQS